jgi:endoribonuclease Dicer
MTPLCADFNGDFGDMEEMRRLLRSSKEAASELGEWAADHLFFSMFVQEEPGKIERKIERNFLTKNVTPPIEVLNGEIERIREARDRVRNHKFSSPSHDGNSISPKVKRLQDYLSNVFEKPTEARCIVFVKQRYTARVLCDLFKRIGSPHMRIGILTGISYATDIQDTKITFRQQVLTLLRFRKGELNCLFATSIAEEGLDIPDCNTIIRFDLYSTLIQYIQSRGRARHKNSKYVHMVEKDNNDHKEAVKTVIEGETMLRKFCEALPSDRLISGHAFDLDDALAKEKYVRTYTEPATKAKLTYRSSLSILAHFVSSLPHDSQTFLQPTYVMTYENKHYTCEVILPESSPIRSITGRPCSRKAIAKCSAAFEACLHLRKQQYLDSYLLPIYHKTLPAMRNAHLALNVKSTNVYEMRVKPSIWEQTWGTIPTTLYLSVLGLTDPESLGRPTQPLALLTRVPLLSFPSFPLHAKPGQTTGVVCEPISRVMTLTESTLTKLTSFTLRIFKDIFNKTYEFNLQQMSYWVAPLVAHGLSEIRDANPEQLIDWPIVDDVHLKEEIPWKIDIPHNELADRYLIDRWDGGRRFFSVGVAPDFRPSDPVPEGCAAHKYTDNILNYTVSLFAKSRARATWRSDQPVILAHRILHRRNWLDDWSETEQSIKTLAYVCPEPLKFSVVRIIVLLLTTRLT